MVKRNRNKMTGESAGKEQVPAKDQAYAGVISMADPAASSHFRPIKQQITLRVDSDVIAWFKANHPRYQTLMNGVLRKEMTHALLEEQQLEHRR